jgi:hypothetical protein
MSALPPIADIQECIEYVCFVPIADIANLLRRPSWEQSHSVTNEL